VRLDRVLFYESQGGRTVDARPLLNLSFAIDYARGESDPAVYRQTNFLIHAVNALLLAALALQLLARSTLPRTLRHGAGATTLAIAVALIWLVHPIHTSAVAYVVQRAESLAAAAILLSLNLFVLGMTRGRTAPLIAAGVVAVLGVLVKEIAATIPLLAIVIDYAFLRPHANRRLRATVYPALFACWPVVLAVMLLTGGREGSAGLAAESLDGVTPLTYLLDQGGNILWYLRLLVWPDPLVLDYGYSLTPLTTLNLLAFAAVVLAFLLTLGLYFRFPRAMSPPLLAAILLGPTSSFIPIVTQPIAEHRMYLAAAALIAWALVGVAWIVCHAPRRAQPWTGRIAIAAGLAAAVALGATTWRRSHDYRSAERMWTTVRQAAPDNPRAWISLGEIRWEQGRYTEAAPLFQRAIELRPHSWGGYANLANTCLEMHQPGRALAIAETGLRETDGGQTQLNRHKAHALMALNRFPEAAETFQRFLQPDFAMAEDWHAYVATLRRMDRLDDAERALAQLQDFAINHPGTHVEMAAVARRRGNPAVAARRLAPVLQSLPGYAPARRERGALLAQAGRLNAALRDLNAAVQLDPADQEALLHRAAVLVRLGRLSAAAADLRAAQSLGARLTPGMQSILQAHAHRP